MATGELALEKAARAGKKRVVVLLSGGMDSAVVMAMALKAGKIVYPLAVDYGQLHAEELRKAEYLCNVYRNHVAPTPPLASLRKIVVEFPERIFGSSLTDDEVKPIDNHRREGATADVYVPARNTFLLALAASYAEQIQAREVHVGFTVRGFPDCRAGYVRSFNVVLAKGLVHPVKIVAPLIRKMKVGVLREALKLDVPLKYTRSCLRRGEHPCGKCNSCFLRARAFKQLGVDDPAI